MPDVFTLTPLEEAQVSIIAKLGDHPNTDNNLSAQELREKFDEAPSNIRSYLNNTMGAELQTKIRSMDTAIASAASAASTSTINTSRLADGAVKTAKIYDGAVTADKIADGAVTADKLGAGSISVILTATIGTSSWTAQGPPYTQDFVATGIVAEDEDHPITWSCTSADQDVLDAYDLLEFNVEANLIHVSTQSVIEVSIPVQATQDNVNYDFTVTTTYTKNGAPFVKVVEVTGLLSTDNPIVDLVPSIVAATAEAQMDSYGLIYKMVVSADDTLTLYAMEALGTSVDIQMLCMRK